MTEAEKIITLVLEADDEDTLKDILGPDFQQPASLPTLKGEVFRHDRWCDVQVGERHWCVSYLTPVAYYDEENHVVRTSKQWSHATINHIKKWLDHIGFDGRADWLEIQRRFPKTESQAELVRLFKEDALRVKWGKRQARQLDAVPYNKIRTGLKGDQGDRVHIDPNHVPKRKWEE